MKVIAIAIALLIVLSAGNINAQNQPKPTKAQQEIISKAKPLQEQLTQLKSQIYDYDKAKSEVEKQITTVNAQLAELQKQFDALPKEEEQKK